VRDNRERFAHRPAGSIPKDYGGALRYQSFRLQILPGPAGGLTVQAHSPCGEGTAPFVPPDSLDGQSPQGVGESLFRALFRGEILHLYESSLALLAKEPAAGLRLELMLDPRDPTLAPLQALPWELMRKPGTPEFLALSRRQPIVRYPVLPRSVSAARRPAILRILAVAASPRSQPTLDLDRELRNLQKAVGSSAAIKIIEPRGRTLADLREALLDQECHVLHFMGHGGVVEGEERVLLFEAEDGAADPVRGTDLVNKLSGFPSLRLVVLNACDSAAVPAETPAETFDPFAGVAVSLVMGGLPAVVAMQHPVSDPAAIAFSRAFYQRLAAGDPVDAAVAEGRQAIHSAHPPGFEWATPVLFLRAPNGEIFSTEEIPTGKSVQKRRVRWLATSAAVLILVGLAGLGARSIWVRHLIEEGVAFAKHNQWPEAHKRFVAAAEYDPGSAEIHSGLANAQEKLGFIKSAEKNFRAAVRLDPESAEHLYSLGSFQNRQQKYQDAYKNLGSAVKRNPQWIDAYGELAFAAFHLSLLEETRESLASAKIAASSLKDSHLRTRPGDLRRAETTWLLVHAYDTLGDQTSTCREVDEFRLFGSAASRWAPRVEEAAARHGC